MSLAVKQVPTRLPIEEAIRRGVQKGMIDRRDRLVGSTDIRYDGLLTFGGIFVDPLRPVFYDLSLVRKWRVMKGLREEVITGEVGKRFEDLAGLQKGSYVYEELMADALCHKEACLREIERISEVLPSLCGKEDVTQVERRLEVVLDVLGRINGIYALGAAEKVASSLEGLQVRGLETVLASTKQVLGQKRREQDQAMELMLQLSILEETNRTTW